MQVIALTQAEIPMAFGHGFKEEDGKLILKKVQKLEIDKNPFTLICPRGPDDIQSAATGCLGAIVMFRVISKALSP